MIRWFVRWLQASALAALAACAETPQAPPEMPADIRVLDRFAFPGGEARVVSAAFLAAPPDTVFADSVAVQGWSLADSTLTVRIPDALGPHTLHARWLGIALPLGTVQVVGFRDARIGPAGGPDVIAWGAPGAPAVLANGDSLLQLVDLATGTVRTTFPDSIHWVGCMWVPGPTTQAGVFVLGGKVSTPGGPCGRHRAWRLWPTVALVDSAPTTEIGYYSAAQSAPTTWILLVHHEIIVYAAGSRTDEWGWGSADALRMSPRGDRVAVLGGGSFANASALPVFAAHTGAVAYRVEAIRSDGGGATFSDDGDTLWAAGTDSATGTWRLFSLESATGRVLAESDTLRWDSDDIALDPSRPYLYVAGTYFPTKNLTCPIPMVRVFDRRSLRLVSTLLPASGTPCVWLGQPQRLLVDPWTHRLYEVGGDGDRLIFYTYDLLP